MGDHDRAKNKRKYPDTGVACGTLSARLESEVISFSGMIDR